MINKMGFAIFIVKKALYGMAILLTYILEAFIIATCFQLSSDVSCFRHDALIELCL